MSDKILQVKNLNVSFPTSMEHFHAVKNVSFDLYRGETLSVIGESGSGIGLTISRGIARAHGGELTATSAGLGHGSTFTLSLPLRVS